MTPKEHIINVAEDLFFRKGFHLTTIRDIASEAIINVSMINYHFRSKEGLYLRLFDKLDSLLVVFQDQVQENAENVEILRFFVEKTLRITSDHPKLVYLFLVEELHPSTDKIKTKVRDIQNIHFKYFLHIASKCTTFKGDQGRLFYASIFGPVKEFFRLSFLNSEPDIGKSSFSKEEFLKEASNFFDRSYKVWSRENAQY